MGQINLVRLGLEYINAYGSFTLTSGVVADHPVNFSSAVAMVCGGINSFVKAAALEMKKGLSNKCCFYWLSRRRLRQIQRLLPPAIALFPCKGS